jgi:hypothetical protein
VATPWGFESPHSYHVLKRCRLIRRGPVRGLWHPVRSDVFCPEDGPHSVPTANQFDPLLFRFRLTRPGIRLDSSGFSKNLFKIDLQFGRNCGIGSGTGLFRETVKSADLWHGRRAPGRRLFRLSKQTDAMLGQGNPQNRCFQACSLGLGIKP